MLCAVSLYFRKQLGLLRHVYSRPCDDHSYCLKTRQRFYGIWNSSYSSWTFFPRSLLTPAVATPVFQIQIMFFLVTWCRLLITSLLRAAQLSCELEPRCFSVNYISWHKTCKLNDATKEYFPGDLAKQRGAFNMSMGIRSYEPCASMRCENGKMCISSFNWIASSVTRDSVDFTVTVRELLNGTLFAGKLI